VHTKSGFFFAGVVGRFSRDSDIEKRELVLTHPAWVWRPDTSLVQFERGERVVLPASEIIALSYKYEPDPISPVVPDPWWRRGSARTSNA